MYFEPFYRLTIKFSFLNLRTFCLILGLLIKCVTTSFTFAHAKAVLSLCCYFWVNDKQSMKPSVDFWKCATNRLEFCAIERELVDMCKVNHAAIERRARLPISRNNAGSAEPDYGVKKEINIMHALKHHHGQCSSIRCQSSSWSIQKDKICFVNYKPNRIMKSGILREPCC